MTVPTSDNGNAAETAKPKVAAQTALPDLSLTDASLKIRPATLATYAVRGVTPIRFEWGYTIKNIKAPQLATKPAPASQAGLEFINPETTKVVDTLHVPELGPGEDNSGSATIIPGEDFAGFQLGTYKIQICANAGKPPVKERSKTNNCRKMRAPYYVIPLRLNGEVHGYREVDTSFVGVPGNAELRWAGTVEFVFDKHSGREFIYRIAAGSSVTFTVSGTATLPTKPVVKCNWTADPLTWKIPESDDANIKLLFGAPKPFYEFANTLPEGLTMEYHLACPGLPDIKAPDVLGGSYWMTSGGHKEFHDPGLILIDGFTALPGPVRAEYTWALYALD